MPTAQQWNNAAFLGVGIPMINIPESGSDEFVRQNKTTSKPVNLLHKTPTTLDPTIKTDIHQFKTVSDKLQQDINKLDNKTNKGFLAVQTALDILSPIPTDRRLQSLPDKIEHKNYTGAGLQVAMAVANYPCDLEFMKDAGKEIKNIFKNGVFPSVKTYEGQREISFFRNTLLQPLAEKHEWLESLDKTLYNTRFGGFIKNIFKIEKFANMTDDVLTDMLGSTNDAAKKFLFKGNLLQKTMGIALLRTSILGVMTTGLLEAPAIIKSVTKTKGDKADKSKAFGKQLLKSAGYVALSTAGIAIGGAVLAPCGVVAGLLGMAIGSTVALTASKNINKMIDKRINV